MVTITEIRTANTSLKSSRSGLTAVITGGTSGIGYGFVKALVSQTDSPKVYLVGRQEKLAQVIGELETINSTGQYIGIQVKDLTLLADTEKAVNQILGQESKVDLLFMSQGYLSFASRDESGEGIDKITSIRHYSRTLLILRLLPLLNAAASPRVISVLAGSKEGVIFPNDLEFKDPKNYSLAKVGDATASYVSLTLEQIQAQNPKISFVHAFPGLTKSSLFRPESFGRALSFFINWVVMPITSRFLWQSVEEAGERFLYVASAPKFAAPGAGNDGDLAVGSKGVKGSGVYTINEKQEGVHNKILDSLRSDGSDVKIFEHTLDTIKRVVGDRI
ncbi:hypothetical protein PFICI_11625 [Pestalotiopsis fici W106-1]|uniref:Uncharacterized protein n=1 Tax=Pestalotiopsis fici (strain W106-1 / CGMCC3.15140) TaxID=1229662 RepID=W3WQX7_PESFW|nr:uncharacterized protein PFICI_11625 [Pestalotiopsis fici W106-1]ETS76238.1 hypothetical protein PFICI_11625 [Pestalotiopsis fici W106-1]